MPPFRSSFVDPFVDQGEEHGPTGDTVEFVGGLRDGEAYGRDVPGRPVRLGGIRLLREALQRGAAPGTVKEPEEPDFMI